jgi:hypothetical protein
MLAVLVEYVPEIHLIQNELEGLPILVANVPVSHAKQDVMLVAAKDVE